MKKARPALQALYRDTFAKHKLDALAFPTVPKVAMAANPESSSVPTFIGVIQNTDPGSNAGVPGVQVAIGLGLASKLPVGMELDGRRAVTGASWPSAWQWRSCWVRCRLRCADVARQGRWESAT